MEKVRASDQRELLPQMFKHLLWSYDFTKIQPTKHKKLIILQAINYGDLRHWRWVNAFYGTDTIKSVLSSVSETEIKPRTRELVSLMFAHTLFQNHAQRSAH